MKILNRPIETDIPITTATDFSNTVLDPEGGVINFPLPFLNYNGLIALRKAQFDFSELSAYYPRNIDKAPEAIRNIFDNKHYWTSAVLYHYKPPFIDNGRVYLSGLDSEANNLIKVMQGDDFRWAQVALDRYYTAIKKATFGKSGLLTRSLLGFRVPSAVNFVATGDPALPYHQVAIPTNLAYKAQIEDNDWVILIRNPVLHDLSVIPMRAKLVDQTYGAVPYRICRGMNMDFDGDMASVTRVPDDFLAREGSETLLQSIQDLNSSKSYFNDTVLFATNGVRTIDENYTQYDFLQDLCDVDGSSIGPEDMIDVNESKFIRRMVDSGAKKLKLGTLEAFKGEASLVESSSAVVTEQIAIKNKLGLVGWLGTCALISGVQLNDKATINAGFHIKERLSQMVLDCKHGTDISNLEMVMAALTRTKEFKESSIDEICDAIAPYLEAFRVRPLLQALHPYSITANMNFNASMFAAANSAFRDNAIVRTIKQTPQARGVLRFVQELLKEGHSNAFRTLEPVGQSSDELLLDQVRINGKQPVSL